MKLAVSGSNDFHEILREQDLRQARDACSNLVLPLAQVTDAKGQSAEDEVSVYVKAAVNMPPVADAGKDIVSWFWFCYRPM